MAYVKTNWVDDVTPLSATNMNNIEDGLAEQVLLSEIENAWENIYKTTLSTNTAQLDISVASKYNEFRIVGRNLKSTNAGIVDLKIRFNGLLGTYSMSRVAGTTVTNQTNDHIPILKGLGAIASNTGIFDMRILNHNDHNRILIKGESSNTSNVDTLANYVFSYADLIKIATINLFPSSGSLLAGCIFEVWGR